MNEEHADWRLNPVTERELALDFRLRKRQRRNVGLLVLSSLGLCPFACFGTCVAALEHSDGGLWRLLSAGASVVLFIWSLIRYSSDKGLALERRAELRREFGSVNGWLVELTVRQGEAISGRDVGVVWFEEDKLFFTGARTSLGLGIENTTSRIVEDDFALNRSPHLCLPLQAESPLGPVTLGIRFEAIEQEGHRVVATEGAFRYALRGWFGAGGKGTGQLPPFVLGPDLDSEWELRVRAVAATAIWPVYVYATTAIALSSGSDAALLFASIGVMIAFWAPARSPRRCWNAVRDRRRLQAYNKEQ